MLYVDYSWKHACLYVRVDDTPTDTIVTGKIFVSMETDVGVEAVTTKARFGLNGVLGVATVVQPQTDILPLLHFQVA